MVKQYFEDNKIECKSIGKEQVCIEKLSRGGYLITTGNIKSKYYGYSEKEALKEFKRKYLNKGDTCSCEVKK